MVSFVRVAEDFLDINSRVTFRVEKAGRDRFRLVLPQGAQLVSLETLVMKRERGMEMELVVEPFGTDEEGKEMAGYRFRPKEES